MDFRQEGHRIQPNDRNMKMPKIVLTHEYPPIPDRRWDWSAHYAGDEDERMDTGWGATRIEAIRDLLENYPREER
jgi:hypothetical protein